MERGIYNPALGYNILESIPINFNSILNLLTTMDSAVVTKRQSNFKWSTSCCTRLIMISSSRRGFASCRSSPRALIRLTSSQATAQHRGPHPISVAKVSFRSISNPSHYLYLSLPLMPPLIPSSPRSILSAFPRS
jgi:hypothetical protein